MTEGSDALQFEFSGLLSDIQTQSGDESVSFTWPNPTEGNQSFNITVKDLAGASETRIINLTVGDNADLPPVFGEIGEITMNEGETRSLTISATDPRT